MKCSKGCEVWVEKSDGDEKDDEWVKLHNMSHCPWCGSPLTEEPKMITLTVTYPEPLTSAKQGDLVFMPSPKEESMYIGFTYDSHNQSHTTMLDRGWLYGISDLAIQRAKAMIGEG